MQTKGWCKLWREQFTHEVSDRKPWCDGYAWAYLYSQANYKAGIANFRNQYVPVERSQFVTSIVKLSQVFGWSRRRTLAYIISLSQRQMLAYRTTNRFMMITICNYEKYQSTEDENETTDVTADVTTDAQQEHTIKEMKKEKEGKKKNILLDFISSLKENPSYKHVDIEVELGKMDAWLLLPKNKTRKKTQTFILKWLNRIDRPLPIRNESLYRDAEPPLPAYGERDPSGAQRVREIVESLESGR